MRNETISREQVLGLLETVQEFIDTNPNEAAALADSELRVDAVYADLNRHVPHVEHRHRIALVLPGDSLVEMHIDRSLA